MFLKKSIFVQLLVTDHPLSCFIIHTVIILQWSKLINDNKEKKKSIILVVIMQDLTFKDYLKRGYYSSLCIWYNHEFQLLCPNQTKWNVCTIPNTSDMNYPTYTSKVSRFQGKLSRWQGTSEAPSLWNDKTWKKREGLFAFNIFFIK